MKVTKRDQIRTLLMGIETGDPEAVKVVNEAKYIQHNPLTREGSIGLAELFKRLSKTSPTVTIARIFEDGDYVFAHTDYDFNVREIGFEVFRFEAGQAVEHWDNLQLKPDSSNRSGHTMIDGAVAIQDYDRTEENRDFVGNYFEEILVDRQLDRLEYYVSSKKYTEHNPDRGDGITPLGSWLSEKSSGRTYQKLHRLLAEGNFVLSVGEGLLNEAHASFYDLFRIRDHKIVEHWDTVDIIPPRSEWKNDNGKF